MYKKMLSAFVTALLLVTVLIPQAHANTRDDVISIAEKYIGVPHVMGGTTPNGFDCSGFVQYVFNKVGISLKRTTDQQYTEGKWIPKSELRPGDIVFFADTYRQGISHDGIYVGNGKFIHVSSSNGVKIDDMSGYYWGTSQAPYYGARRVITDTPPAPLPDNHYYDVKKDQWYYNPITALSKANVFNGYEGGKFKPYKSITRAEVAKVIAEAKNLDTSNTNTPFSDVPSEHWGANEIRAVHEAGYMIGNNGQFRPDEKITRVEIAILFTRVFDLKDTTGGNNFDDVSPSTKYYENIRKFSAADITKGFEDNTFRPQEDANRAQFATFLYRAPNE